MLKSLFFILIFSLIDSISSIYFNDEPFLEYMRTDLNARNYYHPFYNQTIEFISKLTELDQINEQCRRSFVKLIDGVEKNELWALKCKYHLERSLFFELIR